MSLVVLIDDDRWTGIEMDQLAARVFAEIADRFDLDPEATEASLLACDDARIASLNQSFRDKATATNVLSWPSEERGAETPGAHPLPPRPDIMGDLALGDMAIAWETCEREAQTAGIPLPDHVTHLVVHGLLHLLGYDHERDADATLMETLETEILGTLGVDDPYKG